MVSLAFSQHELHVEKNSDLTAEPVPYLQPTLGKRGLTEQRPSNYSTPRDGSVGGGHTVTLQPVDWSYFEDSTVRNDYRQGMGRI